ncbi:Putative aliphatic sulfonates-binding protein [Acaryochloris thomasi RCC1774]|uniref:Aliphatic sulfonates-binding protein n=1 Tax=Acaryochloris thomasi RCC1774 TaxID=1764569 RepID=A0A2W1JVP6_9CYAN|nr:ABC transporter substrate-binding protein [Acaryochloris thomasi]PZD73804.1 Putative aliphatic sulfonates-binding protein [Acaryochloris thomasi RCC1774]
MNIPSRNWTRRNVLWLMTGAIAGVGLHACGSSPETSADSETAPDVATGDSMKAVMGITTWIGNTPAYIALEKGFFKELGLDLELKVFDTVAQGFSSFIAGQLDGLAPVTSEAVLLAAKDVDFKVVTVEDTSIGADAILARNKIGSIQDFKGQQIGVELGGIGHFFVLQVLAEAGLTEQDVTLVNTPPDAAAAAYQAGNLDIVYTYSPFSDKANAAQKDGRSIYTSKQMPTAIADLYIFSAKYTEANPEAVAAFVEGNFKGLEFLNSNREEGLAIMAKQLKITPEELDEQLQGIQMPDVATNIEMLGNPDSPDYMLKPMQELAKFLKEQGQIPKEPDFTDVLDPQFVKALG